MTVSTNFIYKDLVEMALLLPLLLVWHASDDVRIACEHKRTALLTVQCI